MSAWLFDTAVHEKTSGTIASLYRRAMYATASIVFGLLSTTFSVASWMLLSYDHRSARAAMFESSSWESPMPSWIPCSLLIFPPYVIRSSHVVGPAPLPAFSQRLFR